MVSRLVMKRMTSYRKVRNVCSMGQGCWDRKIDIHTFLSSGITHFARQSERIKELPAHSRAIVYICQEYVGITKQIVNVCLKLGIQ
jgi:hypothetical protein